MKRSLITITIIVLFLVGLVTLWFRVTEGAFPWCYFFNLNSIDTSSGEGIDIQQIKIEVTHAEADELIFNGDVISTPSEVYGPHDWIVSYQNRAFGGFRHWKYNDWNDHHYSFKFNRTNKLIECQVAIEGPDALSWKFLLDKSTKADVIMDKEYKRLLN